MKDLFLDEDGENEPTLWRENGLYPIALLRRCEIPEPGRATVWALIEEAVEHG
jgi:hypothetical protein